MKVIRQIIVILLIMLCHTAQATPADMLTALHQMRLAANGIATHFYMFSGLEADAKYNALIDVSKDEFQTALKMAETQQNIQPQPSLASIKKQWQVLNELLETNRRDVLTKGFAEIRLVDDMGRVSTKLVEDINAAYQSVLDNTSAAPPPVVDKSRSLAMLMSEITSLYAAEGTSNLGYLFVGTGENSDTIGDLADKFERLLQQAEAMNVAPAAKAALRDVSSKWGFIEERVRKHNENSVPFLIVSYNEKILEHLALVEASYH